MNATFRKTLLWVSATSSFLCLVCISISRGNYLPYRLFLELGFVWIGMLLGYKLNFGKKTRTITAALSLLLLMTWACRMAISDLSTVFSRIIMHQFICPLAFTLFGAAHSGIMSKEGNKETALKSALVLALLFPLIVVTAYVGNGWTVRSFLEWEDMPWDIFRIVRDCSCEISMYLRFVFYIFLIRMFRSEPLQKIADKKWFKWLAGVLIAFTGVCFFMRCRWFLFSAYFTYRHSVVVLPLPAVWYMVYLLYRYGGRACVRIKQITEK